MAERCLFCRIASGEIPSHLVYESPLCIAFRDIAPKAPVHVRVIPRDHVTSLDTATDAALVGQLALAAAQVARTEGIAASGYRVVTNIGEDGGQSVAHLHFHVLGGRTMTWPPG